MAASAALGSALLAALDAAHRAEREPSAVRNEVAPGIGRAAEHLFSLQAPDGYWCCELTADTTLESDYILLQLWLHQPQGQEWNPPSQGRIERAARSILDRQLPDGGEGAKS